MNFYQFAWKNLIRSRTRTILTVLSIMIASATISIVLSLDRGYKSAVEEELVRKTGIHIFVTKEGCPMEAASVIAQGGISPLYVPEDIIGKFDRIAAIDVIMPFNIFAVTIPDGTRTDIFFGVTEAIRKIRPDWNFDRGGWFKSSNEIILGAELARIEKRDIGDKVYFEQFDREYTVSGILKRNYTQDDGAFFLELEESQRLINREGKLSAIAIKIRDISAINEVKNSILLELPEDYYVITAKELSEGVLKFFGSTKVIMMVMVVIAFLISMFGIANTMLMTIAERRKEFAYMKCVGAGLRQIVMLISIETGIICITGSLSGVLIAAMAAPWFEMMLKGVLIVYVPSASIVRLDALILAECVVSVVCLGIIVSLYPSFKASKITPMEAIRND